MRKNYQRKERKSNHKFEVVRGQELLVRVPLPMAEVWAERCKLGSRSWPGKLGCRSCAPSWKTKLPSG